MMDIAKRSEQNAEMESRAIYTQNLKCALTLLQSEECNFNLTQKNIITEGTKGILIIRLLIYKS